MSKADLDALGRPLVAVTGYGLVTSLGTGATENWAALTAGRSGIRSIRRFPTAGLRTRIAGTVDTLALDPMSAPDTMLDDPGDEPASIRYEVAPAAAFH